MDFAIDLHIHSVLSPCGDIDMTPCNIINMALIKGLDIISVTDHNNASNLPSLSKVAVENGILLLPGIEVQTKEEIHMLCYFKTVDETVEFGNIIYNKLPNIKNNEDVFGSQIVMDSMDNEISKLEKLLLSSADISVKQLVDMVNSFKGVCIPAHIDRKSFSIISNLGFIPVEMNIKTVEISKNITANTAISNYNFLKNYRIIRSSDAHYLWDICERENFLSMEYLTLTNLLNYLRGD